MKLSIIIPVYNISRFVQRCLHSCLNQQDVNRDDYEIIVIDDGSTDNTLEVVRRFSSGNPGIRIFQQQNLGVYEARNNGLKHAKGEYIMFIDGDDFILSTAVSSVIKEIEKDYLDAYWVDFDRVDEEGKPLRKLSCDSKKSLSLETFDGKGFVSNVYTWGCMVWTFVYKKEFLEKKNIYFKNYRFRGDIEFTLRILPLLSSIRYTGLNYYKYCIRKGSLTFSLLSLDKAITNLDIAFEVYTNLKDNYKECASITPLFYKRYSKIITSYMFNAVNIFSQKHLLSNRSELAFYMKSLSFSDKCFFSKTNPLFILYFISPCFYLYSLSLVRLFRGH